MQINFEKLFADYMAANQKVWVHDRALSVGASEAFGCLRQAWFKKRGPEFHAVDSRGIAIQNSDGSLVPAYPADKDAEDSWGATERGNIIEEHFVVPAVNGHLPGKAALLYAGNKQKTFHVGKNSATPDGIIVGLDDDALAGYGIPSLGGTGCIMLEIKSIDPRVNLHEEKTIHRGQTQVQMGIVRETTKYKPNYAVILYVDASFLDKIKVFVVEYDASVWAAAQLRANKVYATEDPALLPAEGKIDKACDFCKFKTACAYVTTGAIPDDNKAMQKDAGLAADFDPLMERYKAAQIAAKLAEANLERLKVEVKESLQDSGTRKLSPKDKRWNLSWYSQAGRKTLNRDRLEEALGDLEPFMDEGDPFDVLRVTFAE